MRRVGIIGAGRIAGQVIEFLRADPSFVLTGVLVRRRRGGADQTTTSDADAFFAVPPDLVVDAAGPAALRRHGERALAQADLWTISAAALADDEFRRRLEETANKGGHRLRVLAGAIGGLDAVAAAAAGGPMRLRIVATRPGMGAAPGRVFIGPLRQAVARFADDLNFAVAAGLAGPGLDATEIELIDPGPAGPHRLELHGESRFGRFNATADFSTAPAIHPVAAAIIAALHDETRPLRIG